MGGWVQRLISTLILKSDTMQAGERPLAGMNLTGIHQADIVFWQAMRKQAFTSHVNWD